MQTLFLIGIGLSAILALGISGVALVLLPFPSKRERAKGLLGRAALLFVTSFTLTIIMSVLTSDVVPPPKVSEASVSTEAASGSDAVTIPPPPAIPSTPTPVAKANSPYLETPMPLTAKPPASAHAAEMDPNALNPYDAKNYPKTYAPWGAKGVKQIETYRGLAAKSVSANLGCDFIETVDLSDNRSVPPNQIVIFVDCRNGARFYLSSAELDAGARAKSIAEVTGGFPDSRLDKQCEDAVVATLRFPSSFDRKFGTTSVYHAPQGNVVVTFDFTAKNGLGIELPQSARCVTDDRGMHPPELSDR